MTNPSCEQARGQLLDYLEGELDAVARDALSGHLGACAECLAELQELERLQARLEAARGRDPEPLRHDFADQVWQAYRREEAAQMRRGIGVRIWQAALARVSAASTPVRWLPAAVAAALVVGIALYLGPEPVSVGAMAAFQARLQAASPGVLAQRGVLELSGDHQFGFAEPTSAASFFRSGHEYARALAAAAAGDREEWRGHVRQIAQSLGSAPQSLQALLRDDASPMQLAALEPELERMAARAGPAAVQSFRAGGWLANLALAAAVRDAAALRKGAPEVLRLRQEMERAGGALPDVLRGLTELGQVLESPVLGERDCDRAARLIRELQLILI
jgi:hypothetical protein